MHLDGLMDDWLVTEIVIHTVGMNLRMSCSILQDRACSLFI